MSSEKLPRACPASRSVDPQGIQNFLDVIIRETVELHSFMMFRGDAVVAEAHWFPYAASRPHMQHSATKSWTATAMGLLIGDAAVSCHDKVISFFPDDLPDIVSENLAAMTVQDLLTMRTGHLSGISGGEWRGMKESWVRAFLREPVPDRPGEQFIYSSGSSYMLSAIVTKVTGRTVHELLEERLFKPMGMGPILWDLSPEGYNTGGNGLRCLTEDVVKFGVLHLKNGIWDGQRLLAEEWVQEATRKQVEDVWLGALDGKRFLPRGQTAGAPAEKREGYGYQWWMTPHEGYRASGLYGQQCIVLPHKDAVIVFTGGLRPRDTRLLDAVWAHLEPALLPPGKSISAVPQKSLTACLAGVAIPMPQGLTRSSLAAEISGRAFAIASNDYHVESVTLTFNEQGCTFQMQDHRGTHSIVCALDGFSEGETTMTGNILHHEYQPPTMRVLGHAVWLDDNRLCLTWRFVETAFCDTVVCEFDNLSLRLHRSVNTNAGPLTLKEISGNFGERS